MLKYINTFSGSRETSSKLNQFVVLLCVAVVLSSCAGMSLPVADPVPEEPKRETIFGEGALDLFGNNPAPRGGAPSIGVNVFLWRATLDTLSAWPVSSADPFGGVILTDWYSTPQVPDELFKMNVYILDRALRADGIRVSVFRQSRFNNSWRDLPVQQETATKIEDAILTRARQFRGSTAQ